jgi:hypothetical protein
MMAMMPLSPGVVSIDDGGMKTRLQQRANGPHRRLAIQLIDDPQDRAQLIMRRVHRWDRAIAQLRASSLDSQLAAGRRPESTRLLATRAQQLVSLPLRRNLVQGWEHVLELSTRAPVPRSPRAPLLREPIRDAEPDLRDMLVKLSSPLPTSARGVAMVRAILTDATGPLFNRHYSPDLRAAVRAAIAQLDSAALTSA